MISFESRAIFLTHPTSLKSTVTGGVQLCSSEFYELIEACGFKVEPYYVNYTRNLFNRLLIKLGFNLYHFYDIRKEKKRLVEYLKINKIEWVFLNMSNTMRFTRPIKEVFGSTVRIVLLSHGNDSGDFIHLITNPIGKYNFFNRIRDIFRLGTLLYLESFYRKKYIDAVLSVSETEQQIENWLGAKISIFVPRTTRDEILPSRPVQKRVGFVGRLDHPPNYQGITMLLDELQKQNTEGMELRLIGAPDNWGAKIADKYAFVTYLGELSDNDLKVEVSTWALFLNPVFWYSTGVTTKLAKAIGWGVPVVSTTAGRRGYFWKKGHMLIADSPLQMAEEIIRQTSSMDSIHKLIAEMQIIRKHIYSINEVADLVNKQLYNIK